MISREYVILNTAGNGNCFFNAIAQAILFYWADEKNISVLEGNLAHYFLKPENKNALLKNLPNNSQTTKFVNQLFVHDGGLKFKRASKQLFKSNQNSPGINKQVIFAQTMLGFILRALTLNNLNEHLKRTPENIEYQIAKEQLIENQSSYQRGETSWAGLAQISPVEEVTGCNIRAYCAHDRNAPHFLSYIQAASTYSEFDNDQGDCFDANKQAIIIHYDEDPNNRFSHFSTLKPLNPNYLSGFNVELLQQKMQVALKNYNDIWGEVGELEIDPDHPDFNQKVIDKKRIDKELYLEAASIYYAALIASGQEGRSQAINDLASLETPSAISEDVRAEIKQALVEHDAAVLGESIPEHFYQKSLQKQFQRKLITGSHEAESLNQVTREIIARASRQHEEISVSQETNTGNHVNAEELSGNEKITSFAANRKLNIDVRFFANLKFSNKVFIRFSYSGSQLSSEYYLYLAFNAESTEGEVSLTFSKKEKLLDDLMAHLDDRCNAEYSFGTSNHNSKAARVRITGISDIYNIMEEIKQFRNKFNPRVQERFSYDVNNLIKFLACFISSTVDNLNSLSFLPVELKFLRKHYLTWLSSQVIEKKIPENFMVSARNILPNLIPYAVSLAAARGHCSVKEILEIHQSNQQQLIGINSNDFENNKLLDISIPTPQFFLKFSAWYQKTNSVDNKNILQLYFSSDQIVDGSETPQVKEQKNKKINSVRKDIKDMLSRHKLIFKTMLIKDKSWLIIAEIKTVHDLSVLLSLKQLYGTQDHDVFSCEDDFQYPKTSGFDSETFLRLICETQQATQTSCVGDWSLQYFCNEALREYQYAYRDLCGAIKTHLTDGSEILPKQLESIDKEQQVYDKVQEVRTFIIGQRENYLNHVTNIIVKYNANTSAQLDYACEIPDASIPPRNLRDELISLESLLINFSLESLVTEYEENDTSTDKEFVIVSNVNLFNSGQNSAGVNKCMSPPFK